MLQFSAQELQDELEDAKKNYAALHDKADKMEG